MTTDPSSRIAANAPLVAWICLHTLELISHCRTVTARIFITPSNDRSIFQNRSKGKGRMCGLNLLHTLEPISITRRRNFHNRSKSRVVGHLPPLSCSPTAELSPQWFPPSHDGSIFQNRSKGRISGLNLLHTLSWSRTAELSPPKSASPQVTIALSPWHHKAKALPVAASCGWSTRAVSHSPSSISASSKVCSKSTRTRFLAVISLRHFFPKACLAFVLTSWTVEEGGSVRSSACPFGKATLYLNHFRRPPNLHGYSKHQRNESLLGTLSPSQARIHDLGYQENMQPSFDRPHGWWHHGMWLYKKPKIHSWNLKHPFY